MSQALNSSIQQPTIQQPTIQQPTIQQLSLWDLLDAAHTQETIGDLGQIWTALEAEVALKEAIGDKLIVSAQTIEQVAQVFFERALLTFEQLDARVSREGPEMPNDAFDRYVRQSMEVEFDDYIESLETLPRKPIEPNDRDTSTTITENIEVETLLALIGEEETPQDPAAMIRILAGDDDPKHWIEQVRGCLDTYPEGRSFLAVQRETQLEIVEAWLGTLLGQIQINQVGEGDFYAGDRLWLKR